MTRADRAEFAVEMALLAEVFGEQLSETRLEIYFQDLSIYDLGHVVAGLKLARQTRRFFPKPIDISECIDEAVEARVQAHVAAGKAQYGLPAGPRTGQLGRFSDLVALPPKEEAR